MFGDCQLLFTFENDLKFRQQRIQTLFIYPGVQFRTVILKILFFDKISLQNTTDLEMEISLEIIGSAPSAIGDRIRIQLSCLDPLETIVPPQPSGIISDFSQIMFGPFGFLVSKNLNNLAFKYFDFERHLMKVIPERRRVH